MSNTEKSIEQLASLAIKELEESGALQEQITKAVQQTVERAIEKSTASYTDFSRALEEKFQEKLLVASHSIKVPDLTSLVCGIIDEYSIDIIKAGSLEPIRQHIQERLGVPKKEWSAREVAEEYFKSRVGFEVERVVYGSAHFIENDRHDWLELCLDPEGGKPPIQCRDRLVMRTRDNVPFTYSFEGVHASHMLSSGHRIPRCSHFLWRLLAGKCKITGESFSEEYYERED